MSAITLDWSKYMDIHVRYGATINRTFDVKYKATGLPFDFTGHTVVLEVYSSEVDRVPNLVFNDADGILSEPSKIKLSKPDTIWTPKQRRRSFIYFLWVTDPSNNKELWLNGKWLVEDGVNSYQNTTSSVEVDTSGTPLVLELVVGGGSSGGFTLANGSGTTANGSAVDIGGEITPNTNAIIDLGLGNFSQFGFKGNNSFFNIYNNGNVANGVFFELEARNHGPFEDGLGAGFDIEPGFFDLFSYDATDRNQGITANENKVEMYGGHSSISGANGYIGIEDGFAFVNADQRSSTSNAEISQNLILRSPKINISQNVPVAEAGTKLGFQLGTRSTPVFSWSPIAGISYKYDDATLGQEDTSYIFSVLDNHIETNIFKIGANGIEYFIDQALANTSNPLWVPNKAYIDSRSGWLLSGQTDLTGNAVISGGGTRDLYLGDSGGLELDNLFVNALDNIEINNPAGVFKMLTDGQIFTDTTYLNLNASQYLQLSHSVGGTQTGQYVGVNEHGAGMGFDRTNDQDIIGGIDTRWDRTGMWISYPSIPMSYYEVRLDNGVYLRANDGLGAEARLDLGVVGVTFLLDPASKKFKITNLPTSSAGLTSGMLWRDAAAGNVIKMVP